MKTLKLIACIILICAASGFAQNTPATPSTPPTTPAQKGMPAVGESKAMPNGQQMPGGLPRQKMDRYMVQIPHTKENCQKIKDEMKEKGGAMLMRFDWGCSSGDHTGYAVLPGQSEDAIRKMLPESVQKTAKITKVERYNPSQIMDPNSAHK